MHFKMSIKGNYQQRRRLNYIKFTAFAQDVGNCENRVFIARQMTPFLWKTLWPRIRKWRHTATPFMDSNISMVYQFQLGSLRERSMFNRHVTTSSRAWTKSNRISVCSTMNRDTWEVGFLFTENWEKCF